MPTPTTTVSTTPARPHRNDPTHVSLPLHEAWAVLLEGYLPHLLSEAEGAAACLLLRRGDLERAGEWPRQEEAGVRTVGF